MLTFQDMAVANSSQTSAAADINNVGGIVCVLVTNGSNPRMAFYGEGRLGQGREYRFIGHAFAQQMPTTSSSNLQSPSQVAVSNVPMVNIGGYQVESQLYGSFAGTSSTSDNSSISSIANQVSLTVSTDRIIMTDGSSTRTWLLKSDIPNYQPLALPITCGDNLEAFKVRYPPGVSIPHPSVGLRCVMPHQSRFMITYLAVGYIGSTSYSTSPLPYMYLATRGKGGAWGRVGICWHNQYLTQSGKCPKSDFGSFIVKPMDLQANQTNLNGEVQNGLRELWVPRVASNIGMRPPGSNSVESVPPDSFDQALYAAASPSG